MIEKLSPLASALFSISDNVMLDWLHITSSGLSEETASGSKPKFLSFLSCLSLQSCCTLLDVEIVTLYMYEYKNKYI